MNCERSTKLARWITAYEEELYHLAYALLKNEADAQDAVGEMIVKVYEQKPQFEDNAEFRPWVTQILMGEVHDMIQKQKYMEEIPDIENVGITKLSYQTTEDILWNVVDRLDPEYRMILILYYFESFSIGEISEILKLSETSVRTDYERQRND